MSKNGFLSYENGLFFRILTHCVGMHPGMQRSQQTNLRNGLYPPRAILGFHPRVILGFHRQWHEFVYSNWVGNSQYGNLHFHVFVGLSARLACLWSPRPN